MKGMSGKSHGFTLLEVLVALVLATFALAALWQALSQGIAMTEGLSDRVLASWIAHNRIVLRQASGQWPETRTYEGSEAMAGRKWYWEEQVKATSEPQLRRLTVKVGKTPDSLSLVTLEGFFTQARPVSPSRLPDANEGTEDEG